MFDRILRRMRELVRTNSYVVTAHCLDEMEADGLSVFDLEHCLLVGEIIERQKDRETGEWKYRILGGTLNGQRMVVVAKIGPAGKLIIITVYLT